MTSFIHPNLESGGPQDNINYNESLNILHATITKLWASLNYPGGNLTVPIWIVNEVMWSKMHFIWKALGRCTIQLILVNFLDETSLGWPWVCFYGTQWPTGPISHQKVDDAKTTFVWKFIHAVLVDMNIQPILWLFVGNPRSFHSEILNILRASIPKIKPSLVTPPPFPQ